MSTKEELLSDAEKRAMSFSVQLVNCITQEVIADGPTRDYDVAEIVYAIHGIQHMIMSQACARAYPAEFRLLGSVIEP